MRNNDEMQQLTTEGIFRSWGGAKIIKKIINNFHGNL